PRAKHVSGTIDRVVEGRVAELAARGEVVDSELVGRGAGPMRDEIKQERLALAGHAASLPKEVRGAGRARDHATPWRTWYRVAAGRTRPQITALPLKNRKSLRYH